MCPGGRPFSAVGGDVGGQPGVPQLAVWASGSVVLELVDSALRGGGQRVETEATAPPAGESRVCTPSHHKQAPCLSVRANHKLRKGKSYFFFFF